MSNNNYYKILRKVRKLTDFLRIDKYIIRTLSELIDLAEEASPYPRLKKDILQIVQRERKKYDRARSKNISK